MVAFRSLPILGRFKVHFRNELLEREIRIKNSFVSLTHYSHEKVFFVFESGSKVFLFTHIKLISCVLFFFFFFFLF